MDNPALQAAVLDPTPTLLVYSFEPMLLKNDHYDNRHWQYHEQRLQGFAIRRLFATSYYVSRSNLQMLLIFHKKKRLRFLTSGYFANSSLIC